MSGGGDTQEDDIKFKQYDPSTDPRVIQEYPGVATAMTLPQGGPGQLEALAAQLAGGFGQSSDAMYNWLDNIYAPTEYQTYGRQGTPASPVSANASASRKLQNTQPKPRQMYMGRAAGAFGLPPMSPELVEAMLRDHEANYESR